MKLKNLILLSILSILFACSNKKEELQAEIDKLTKESQKLGDDVIKITNENLEVINFRARKQIAAQDSNYPTPDEDAAIEKNQKSIDSLGIVLNTKLSKIDSLEKELQKIK